MLLRILFILQIVILVCSFHIYFGMAMPGGFKHSEPADSEVQAILDSVKKDVIDRTHKNFIQFDAIEYQTQVVIYYFIF